MGEHVTEVGQCHHICLEMVILAEGRVCDPDWANLGDGDFGAGEVAAPILCQEMNAIEEMLRELAVRSNGETKSPSL